ncbi:MAG TPA: hypothetical protein VFA08_08615 [Actinomycetota bacterium]|jgi:hypothetical protein|nr:hypothetical protein [Actinomycetota bacterium]
MALVSARHDVQVEVSLGEDPVTLEWEIAMAARRVARDLFLCAVAALEEEAISQSGGARQRREPRWVATVFGRVRLHRYRVRRGDATFHPADEILRLRRGEASMAVREIAVELTRKLSYRDTAYVLSLFTGDRFTYQHVGRLLAEAAHPPTGHDA